MIIIFFFFTVVFLFVFILVRHLPQEDIECHRMIGRVWVEAFRMDCGHGQMVQRSLKRT